MQPLVAHGQHPQQPRRAKVKLIDAKTASTEVAQHSEWRSDQPETNDNSNDRLTFENLVELDTMWRCMKDDEQLTGLEHIAGYRDNEHRDYFCDKVRQLLADVGDSRL